MAIDCTGSNGNPNDPATFRHAVLPEGPPNDYQRAIKGISEIILEFSASNSIELFGFGGCPCFKTFQGEDVMHCFSLTGDEHNPTVQGLDGVMKAYEAAMKPDVILMAGPTRFTELIQKSMEIAEAGRKDKKYQVLLILTDGMIDDMDSTIDLLAKCTKIPLSIIIIGVGEEDFGKMQVLDGD